MRETKIGDVFSGLAVGGAAGFLLTETAGALISFVLGVTVEAPGGGAVRAICVAVPVLGALIGAVVGARHARRAPAVRTSPPTGDNDDHG
jgi:hypothetical protein